MSLLTEVSLDVPHGQVIGVVGESGSGKSTLCRAVARLLPAGLMVTGGSVEYQGRDLLQARARDVHRLAPRGIAMVFQDPLAALNPVLHVGDQVDEAVWARHRKLTGREIRTRTVELLDRLELPDADRAVRRYPHEFSGGQRQRIMLAIALAGDPALLLADEPTSALDVRTQAEILRLLAELVVERDLALVFVSHDYAVVSQLCHRVVVLYGGRVLEQGATADLLHSPRHPYTAALIGALPAIERRQHRLAVIDGQPASEVDRSAGCPFAPRCPHREAVCDRPFELTTLPGERATACHRVHDLWPEPKVDLNKRP